MTGKCDGQIEGVHGKKALTLVHEFSQMSNSPFLYKEAKSNLLGESCSLPDVTQGLFHAMLCRVTLCLIVHV